MRRFGDKLELTLKERDFDGSDEILVFESLRSLFREPDLAGMSEAPLYFTLPRMLRNSVYEHFVAIGECSPAEGGRVKCWPETVQYLLRSYATPPAVSNVVNSASDLKQSP